MKEPLIDPRKADAGYKGFPSFTEWAGRRVDEQRWHKYSAPIKQQRDIPRDQLQAALRVARRAAAIDTGAIEGLYDVDRGFTITVATQAAMWESLLESKGNAGSFIESQLQAYEYVLDFATQQVPIVEAWIRELHSIICANQETYKAYTEIGIQDLPLPKGVYKHLPNHVITRDGLVHSYAPVDLTPAEMHRFCVEISRDEFKSAHPVLQASYAHYAFAAIHPFADGNGRVARALASVFTYRSDSIPLLILAENRGDYLSSLRSTDEGNYQAFVDFVFERGLDAFMLVAESLHSAGIEPLEEKVNAFNGLYVTRSGYTHETLDAAGTNMFDIIIDSIKSKLETLTAGPMLEFTSVITHGSYPTSRPNYRLPQTKRTFSFTVSSKPPIVASVTKNLAFEVPKNPDRDDTMIVQEHAALPRIQFLRGNRDDTMIVQEPGIREVFEVRIGELIPAPTAALRMRISMASERVVSEALDELYQIVKSHLGSE